jgi:hypothetical protein
MVDVVRIERGDVLIISNVSFPEEPEAFEGWGKAVTFLREHAGIACLVVAEDAVRLDRLPADVVDSLTASARDRMKRHSADDGRD